jgi:hypothetical protein
MFVLPLIKTSKSARALHRENQILNASAKDLCLVNLSPSFASTRLAIPNTFFLDFSLDVLHRLADIYDTYT